jgi:hypothetical protein
VDSGTVRFPWSSGDFRVSPHCTSVKVRATVSSPGETMAGSGSEEEDGDDHGYHDDGDYAGDNDGEGEYLEDRLEFCGHR